MFTPQQHPVIARGDASQGETRFDPNGDFNDFVNVYESSQGRYDNPLGNDYNTPGVGRAEVTGQGAEPEYAGVDVWGDQLNYPWWSTPGYGGANVNEGGRGDRAPLPRAFFPERPPRNFVAYYFHQPYQGWQELRENVGGHVVVRWMPNAGQAQGGMGGWSPQVNQRRILPDRWDAQAFING